MVTGTGMLSALGNDVTSTWENLVAGRSGIGTITRFDPSRLTARIAGEVKDFDPSAVLDRKEQRRTDRYVQYTLVATRQAVDQAGLPDRLEGGPAERTGMIIGAGLGGVESLFEQTLLLGERGPERLSPFMIPMAIGNLAAGQVAISFGPTGPNFTVASACATGGHAIGEAWETIRRDDADIMFAGGSEAGLHSGLVGGLAAMRALSTRNDDPTAASRPFDRGRDGFVYGEGADVLVLEELGHALTRGATPLIEIVGDVIAHAASTPEGDRAELQGLRTLFGERTGCVPPTINLEYPDEAAAGLDLTPNTARTREMDVAISNSFGFGGQNSAVVFRRWTE